MGHSNRLCLRRAVSVNVGQPELASVFLCLCGSPPCGNRATMWVMKAIRVHVTGGPEVLKLEDVPDPSPGPGQVLVKVHAVGVNPVETYIRAGRYGWKDFP